jgi:methionine biosynthesis protein MetW
MSEKLHYDFQLNLGHSSNVHRIELEMIPEGVSVLDVGCHSGIMGQVLREKKQAKVIGIDTDPDALHAASRRLDAALFTDIDQRDWTGNLFAEGYENFDVILFGDVLEHTHYPERILEEVKKLLKPGGEIIVSIPNIAHWRIRMGLLFGRFDYADSGILDRTHLHFYTRLTARKLLEENGYRISRMDVAGYNLPHWLLRLFPGLLAVQFVMSAKPK